MGTIFLPIPNQIQDQNGVNWGSDSLNGLAAAGVDAASAVMQSGDIGKAFTTAGNQMSNFTSKILSSGNGGRNAMNAQLSAAIVNALGGNTTGSGLLARASGQILNPNMELLFNGVTLRSFNFTFDLAPRDQPESTTIKK